MISNEAKKNIEVMMRVYNELINEGKVNLFEEVMSKDFVEHEVLPGFPPNREGTKQFFAMFRNEFPDITFFAEDITANEDKVWTYYTMHGTHKNEFMGIPPYREQDRSKGI